MSGKRDESLLLDDLIDATARLIELGKRVPVGRLGEDRDLSDSLMWNLVVLGDATNRLSTSTRARFSNLPWRDMAETRVHIPRMPHTCSI